MAEPTFIPKPGQTDYTKIRYAPVINIVVTHKEEILLVKRSSEMRLYPNCWNGVSGFLDDSQSISEKAYEELKEELHLSKESIRSLKIGQVLLQEAPEYKKTWLVVPILVNIKTKDFKLNWESQAAQWFQLAEIKNLQVVPDFDRVIGQFFTFPD